MTIPATRRPRLAAFVHGGVAALTLTVVATVTLGAPAQALGSATPSTISDSDIAAAGIAVMAFGLRNVGTETIAEPCPILSQEQLGGYFAQQGYTANLTGFTVGVFYETDVAEGYPGIDCMSDIPDPLEPDPAAPHYPAIAASFLHEGTTFADYLTGTDGQTILTPSVPGIGGEIGGVCQSAVCYLHWHRSSLVVSVLVAGGLGDITRAKTETMLTAMVPDVVTNLKVALEAGVPITTTTTAPPTTAVTPTTVVPATTTAPQSTAAVPPTTVAATSTVVASATVDAPATRPSAGAAPSTAVALPALPSLPGPPKTTPG